MPHEPLYRPVLRDAFAIAWREKRLWPVALGAGILLSGSIYDVMWRFMNVFTPQASLASTIGLFWGRTASNWSSINVSEAIFGGIKVFQLTAFFLVIGFAIAALSIICQGALVFAIGNGKGVKRPLVKEALTVGARAFWPVLVLNILSLAILFSTRALLAIVLSLALEAGTAGSQFLYLISFIVFVLLTIAVTIIQILALNAMILQGATLAQGLERGGRLLQRHWVVTVETALILFVISIGAWMLAVVANAILAVPFFMLLITSAMLGSQTLLMTTLILGLLFFFVILFLIGAILVSFQYATWTLLYRRLGEGGALPKIHRWVRQITHGYHVPGA